MKITLISPTWKQDTKKIRLKRARTFRIPQISLLAVAAVTPSDITVEMVDENVETLGTNLDTDLVGISTMTATAPRAYEIADEFRARGIPVVLGGMHPSAMPQEALSHADAVIVGEAELTWPNLVEDFRRRGRAGLQQIYQNGQRIDMRSMPPLRRSLLDNKNYFFKRLVQVSRGCPYDCSFCAVTRFFGKKYRFRPVDDVVAEIRGMIGKSMSSRVIGFMDDNIMGNIRYAKKLFRALIPLKIYWMGQASVNTARDTELLRLASRSGCRGLFVGLESISPESLQEASKGQNDIRLYRQAIRRFHRFQISVLGAFIFGFDHDDTSVFRRTVRFINKIKLDAVQFGILTPLPGTRLHERMERENRIVDRNWANYDIANCVFQPKLMEPQEVKTGFTWAYQQIYSIPSIVRRLSVSLFDGRWRYLPILLIMNLGYRKTFQAAEKVRCPG